VDVQMGEAGHVGRRMVPRRPRGRKALGDGRRAGGAVP
jgi:hypothetical protein